MPNNHFEMELTLYLAKSASGDGVRFRFSID